MRCPGQDRRYWTEDAVFEVPCPECGKSVELFKDETSARCTGCGHRFRNPGIDFGCAQWCALAEQCLGLVPERDADSQSKEGALAGVLIQRLSEIFASDVSRLARSLKVYHYAKELVPKLPADPRITLAAALLSGLCVRSLDEPQTATADGSDKAQQILQEIGVDENTTARVHEILACYETGKVLDCVEFHIVHDAHTLDTLAAQVLTTEAPELAEAIETRLVTKAAKAWAGKWCQGRKDEVPQGNDETPNDE
jgi:hypothetical protein